jgi:type IV fimbrial biogenesis protein FimT
MLTRTLQAGVTLIELLIGITIVCIAMALGLPTMSTFIQNNKIGSVVGNYYGGLQMARTEAIRSNDPVEFVMTNGTGLGALPSPNGRNWIVRAVPLVGAARLIDQKIAVEGEGVANPAVQVTVLAAPAGFDGRITFNGFGAPTANPYSLDITNPALGACAPVGPARCRRINVTSGGQITACDPAAAPAAGDTRAC